MQAQRELRRALSMWEDSVKDSAYDQTKMQEITDTIK
jgi:hypothetical protein